jgi:hypothetical protein
MTRKNPPNRELKYSQTPHDSGFENHESHGGIGRISSSARNHRNEQAHTSQENIAQGHLDVLHELAKHRGELQSAKLSHGPGAGNESDIARCASSP